MTSHVSRTRFVVLAVACLALGCTQADQDRWNQFWAAQQPGGRTSTAGAPQNSTTAAAARPASAETEALDGEDPDNVNRNVSDYVASMSPSGDGAPPANDRAESARRGELAAMDTGGSDTAAFRAELSRREAQRQNRAATGDETAPSGTAEGVQAAAAGDIAPGNAQLVDSTSPQQVSVFSDETAGDAFEQAPEASDEPSPVRIASDASPSEEDAQSGQSPSDSGPAPDRAATIADREAPAATTEHDSPTIPSGDGPATTVTANAGGATVETPNPAPEHATGATNGAPEVAEITIKPAAEGVEGPSAMVPNAGRALADQPVNPAADSLTARIRRHEELVAQDPNNIEEQFRLRMLYLVEGQDDKALAPVPGVDRDIEEIILSQVRTLIAARSGAGRDSATWANRQLESVEQLRSRIRARADLQVPVVQLCTSVDAFGRYKPIENLEFPAGVSTLVIIYIEVENFSSTRLPSDQYRTVLSVRESLINRSGEELWSAKEDNIEDVARQQREDFFITSKRGIPRDLPPGEYTLKVEVEDIQAGKINSNSVKFKIVP